MFSSFPRLGSLRIAQPPTNLHVPPPLQHSIRRSKTPLPTGLHEARAHAETAPSPLHFCKPSPIGRVHTSDGHCITNGCDRHHIPTIRFRFHTSPESAGLSPLRLPLHAHSTRPSGILQEKPNDSVSDRHNDGLSLLPQNERAMKTCGFQTFPSVTDPVAETTGNNKFNL